MKLVILFAALLATFAAGAPTSDDDKLTITEDFFPESLAVYTAEHEIVNLYVPLNALNFEDDTDSDEADDADTATLFFALADVAEDGGRTDQGFYVLKKGAAIKLLDEGRDATADNGDNKLVYIGAKDGLYVYNDETNKADKYGAVTDSIVQLAKANGTDVLYILTEGHELFKVTEEGTKKTKMDDVNGAKEFVLDFNNNLYYLDDAKQLYVVSEGGVKKISGLPDNYSYAKLMRPAFVFEDSTPFVVDNALYIVYANGTSESTDITILAKPSAYAMDATLIQYYAYDKKIYEYNILALLFSGILEGLQEFLSDKRDRIQSIATRSRSDLRA